MVNVKEFLYANRDEDYREFQSSLIPTVDKDRIIGVRTPVLRRLAKELYKNAEYGDFTSTPSHKYYEEECLHGFIIERISDFDLCIKMLDDFLPYVDNWASCDSLSPSVFKKNRSRLLPYIEKWIDSGKTYTVRFAIKMLMQHFLDEDFDASYLEKVASVKSEEYYVKMMVAWYFQVALTKQYDLAIRYIEEGRLSPWIHNKAIQKAKESLVVSKAKKEN